MGIGDYRFITSLASHYVPGLLTCTCDGENEPPNMTGSGHDDGQTKSDNGPGQETTGDEIPTSMIAHVVERFDNGGNQQGGSQEGQNTKEGKIKSDNQGGNSDEQKAEGHGIDMEKSIESVAVTEDLSKIEAVNKEPTEGGAEKDKSGADNSEKENHSETSAAKDTTSDSNANKEDHEYQAKKQPPCEGYDPVDELIKAVKDNSEVDHSVKENSSESSAAKDAAYGSNAVKEEYEYQARRQPPCEVYDPSGRQEENAPVQSEVKEPKAAEQSGSQSGTPHPSKSETDQERGSKIGSKPSTPAESGPKEDTGQSGHGLNMEEVIKSVAVTENLSKVPAVYKKNTDGNDKEEKKD